MLITVNGLLFFLLFGSSYATFGFAIQFRINSRARRCLTVLNAFFGAASVKIAGDGGFAYHQLWTLTAINATLHSFALLALDGLVVHMQKPSYHSRLRVAFRHWNNVRYLDLDASTTTLHDTNRIVFAGIKCSRIFLFWALLEAEVALSSYLGSTLQVTVWDLSPEAQGLLPYPDWQHICFRCYESIRWIIYTYLTLTAGHDLSAMVFVSLLRWDQPSEWPALFGSITEAYSLRRFWGVFWHRLNLGISDAYLPSVLLPSFLLSPSPSDPKRVQRDKKDTQAQDKEDKPRAAHPSIRALWVFFFSALYHAAANWSEHRQSNLVAEMRFFLANFAVCFVETTVRKALARGGRNKRSRPSIAVRLLGYIWVYFVFFVLVPGWKWPMAWANWQRRRIIPADT